MCRLLVVFVVNLAVFASCLAQSNREVNVDLQDLQIPGSPAFILLDVAPTSIERPRSMKAIMASVVSSISENNGIPKNYAIEFTPFWFMKHPDLTAFKYWGYDPKTNKQNVFSPISQYSISFASVKSNLNDSLNPNTTNLAFGIKTMLFRKRSSSDIEKLIMLNSQVINELKQLDSDNVLLDGMIQDIEDQIDSAGSDDEIEKLKIKQKVLKETKQKNLVEASNRESSTSYAQQIKDILARRPVFSIDFALASTISFNDFNFSDNRIGRFGGWINSALAISLNSSDDEKKTDYLDIILTARLLQDRNIKDAQNKYINRNYFDAGGKFELQIDRLSVGYEYVYRHNQDNSLFRSSGIIKIKVSESLYLTGAFGKNFGDRNNLISQVGINWGIDSGNELVKAGGAQL